MSQPSVRAVLRRAKRVTHAALRKAPAGQWVAGAVTAQLLADRLLVAGVFDQEYYEAQCGRRFASRRAAAADYLRRSRTVGYAPNPLFEPSWFDRRRTSRTRSPLLTYLAKGPGKFGSGPVFDDARYAEEHPDALQHPGRALGRFLTHASADTPVPVPEGFVGSAPAWGALRAALLEQARRKASAAALLADRRVSRWDAPIPDSPAAADLDAREGESPLVSVVVYAGAGATRELVDAAVLSARGQSLRSIEVLVVACADVDADVVAGATADGDARVRVLGAPSVPSGLGGPVLAAGQGRLAGPGAARNLALAAATGRYVAFLDAGFTWAADHLRHAVAVLEAGEQRAVQAVAETLVDGQAGYLAFEGGMEHLLAHNHLCLSTFVAQRGLIAEVGGFDEGLAAFEDHDLALAVERIAPMALVPFLGARQNAELPPATTPTQAQELAQWQWVVLGKHHVRWDDVTARLGERVPGRVSVSMPTYEDWQMTVRAVDAVLTTAGDHDVEVIVVDNGSARAVSAVLTARYLAEPRVRVLAQPRNLNFAIGSNLGMAVSTGETVVFLNNDTDVLPGWLDHLLAELDDEATRGVQPLLLFPDGTIQSAGSVLPGGDTPPMPFLVNHPPEDALRAAPIRMRIITAACMAVRAAEFARLRGFDPVFVNGQEDVDYCLRAVDTFGGQFAVATDAVVFHHEGKSPGRGARIQVNRRLLVKRWQGRFGDGDLDLFTTAGFEVASLDPGPPAPNPDYVRVPKAVLVRPSRTVPDGPGAGLPCLRWAIKLAAWPGPRGDGWGDVHFAAALQRALERLGQEVVVDRRLSHDRETCDLDDVALVIRGLDKVDPQPGRVNLMWLISHPELVDAAELLSFDHVFAASTAWAAKQTAAGVPVSPLLQATEPARFNPDAGKPCDDGKALFVGRARNVLRPIVRDSVEAGVPLNLYGDGWGQFGLGDVVTAQYLPYDDVPAAYASADVVLNDHWTDMAAEGFYSNRLFDAVACGARVVSDHVDGVEGLFEGCVREYATPADLARLCSAAGRADFPDDDTRREIGFRLGQVHSFDARARRLLDTAMEVLAARRSTGTSTGPA